MRTFSAVLLLFVLCGCGGQPTTAPSTPAGKPNVVFIGDSMLGGSWSGNTISAFPQYNAINKGIGGNTADQMLARFQTDVIDLHPDVVVIWGSGNGMGVFLTTAQVESDWVAMMDLARANNIRIIMATLAPHGAPSTTADDGGHREVDDWLRVYAFNHHDIVLADFYAALAGPDLLLKPEYNQDGVHLTDAGHAALVPVAVQAIEVAIQPH